MNIANETQNFSFRDWWSAVLEKPLLSCVFCGKNLKVETHNQCIGPFRGGHMLAYWRESHDSKVFVAAGMYCWGREHGCLSAAERVGVLYDCHAPSASGDNAWPHLLAALTDGWPWESTALRRFVLLHGELAWLPTVKAQR